MALASLHPPATVNDFAGFAQALHELRSIAHIVDMHQLTKDPELVASNAINGVETLTNGLSRNIWQKIMILDTASGGIP